MADRPGRDNVGPGGHSAVGPGDAGRQGPGGPQQLSKSDNYAFADRRQPPQTNGVGPGGPGGRGLSNGGQEGPGAGYGRSARVSRRDLGPGQQQLDPGQVGGLGGLGPGDRGRSAPAASNRGSPGGRRPGGRGGPGGPGNTRSYNTSPSGGGYLPPDTGLNTGLHSGHPGDHGDFDTGRMERGMDRGMDRSGGPHARSRSASRGFPTRTTGGGPGYHSLDRDRDGYGGDRDFMPIDRPRDRSLDRPMDRAGGPGGMGDYGPPYSGSFGRRDRSLDRSRVDPMSDLDDGTGYRDRDPHRTRLSPNPISLQRDAYMQELQSTNSDLQRDLANLKKELELTNQKLGSSMHSIKTFWSPELKKERALRKEESAKYALMNDQLKLLNSENQVREVFNLVSLINSSECTAHFTLK